MNQENVKEDNLPNKENPKCNFVYFIDTHENKKNHKIYLPDDYEGKDSLEKIHQKELNNLSSEVYRFKIIPGALKKSENHKYKILILADDEEGNKHQYEIKFSDENKDHYEYDFKVEEIDFQLLSLEEQFEIYVEILRKNKKTMNSPENENLIVSTSELFENEEMKYTFTFYFLIFLECFNTKNVQEHLLRFKAEKIEGLGVFPESKVKVIQNRLNIISKNPEKCLYLKDINDEDKEEMIGLFYSILLFFNMNYQKEKVEEMFKDNKILNYLSKKLISFGKLFQDLILPKDIVRNLIKKTKNFEEILGLLPYLGTDTVGFLQLIFSEFEFIKEVYGNDLDKLNEENENKDEKDRKEMKKIVVEDFVIPKKEENIEKLIEVCGLIFMSEKTSNLNIIKFSKSLIEKYVDFYYTKNLDFLQLINTLINLIKKNDNKFVFKYKEKDMDLIIHETGLELIKNGKIKNIGILDFIKSDIYFISPQFEKKQYRPLEIFDGIEIETLDEKFFNNWKIIDLHKMFIENFEKFCEKIMSLINDMKDFGLFYKFFIFNNEKEYKREYIIIIKDKYKALFPTYNIERCPNFLEDTILLISLLDKKKVDLKEFLEFIQNNLDYEKVNEIYIKLSDRYKLNNKTKEIIAGHFAINKNNNNPTTLVYLIKNCKN